MADRNPGSRRAAWEAELLADVGTLHDLVADLKSDLPKILTGIRNALAITDIKGILREFIVAIVLGAIGCLVAGGAVGYFYMKATDSINVQTARDAANDAMARASAAEAKAANAVADADARAATEIQKIQEAAKWAGTAEGKVAKIFFEKFNGFAVVACSSSQWEIRTDKAGNRYCIPKAKSFFSSDAESGWRIP